MYNKLNIVCYYLSYWGLWEWMHNWWLSMVSSLRLISASEMWVVINLGQNGRFGHFNYCAINGYNRLDYGQRWRVLLRPQFSLSSRSRGRCKFRRPVGNFQS
jgi:hypothetical protein